MGRFDFGAFAGGLAEGLSRGQELKLRANESKLKAKMLEHQLKTQEFDQQERVRKSQEQAQQQIELGRYVDMATTGMPGQPPAPLQPGAEGPEPEPGFEVPRRPATSQELLGQGLKSVPATNRASLIGQSLKPQAAMTRPVKPGDFVPDPNDPSGYRQIGTPSKAGEERSLTIGEIQRLYPELPPDRAQVVSTLPAKAQERTLDNVRAQSRQEQSTTRFEAREDRQTQQFREAEDRRAQQFQERERVERERIQLQEDRLATPPLSGKESTDLTKIRGALTDIRRARDILSGAKGKFTGPLDTRAQDLKGAFNRAPAEYNELTTILAKLRNQARHESFGSALTNPEIKESLRELVEERQSDSKVKARIQFIEERFAREEAGLSNREQFWKQRGGGRGPAPTQGKTGGAPVGTTKKLGGKTFRKTGPGELDWDVVQ